MKGRDLRTLAHREYGFGVQRALHFAVEHGAACPAGGGKVGARHAAPQGDDGRAQDLYRAFHVELNGEDSGADLVSRSVARGNSHQAFYSVVEGNNRCTGHSACDAIIADNGKVDAQPALNAANVDAQLIHEAAIGKIAGEQILKLCSLGLTREEAEEKIIEGFLK